MTIKSKRALAPDPGHERLRTALVELRRFTSPEKMINLAADHAKIPETFMSANALRDFLRSKSRELEDSNYRLLAEFWLASTKGRALRRIDSEKATPFEALVRKLEDSAGPLSDGFQAIGEYYLYHGSYLLPNHYVIRQLTIELGEDQVLSVEDIVRDSKTAADAPRRATGIMTFVDGRPQILLYANENKQGLSLLIFHDIVWGEQQRDLKRGYGALMVMNQHRQVAFRPCLLVREEGEDASARSRKALESLRHDMVAETGIFTASELKDPRRRRHAQEFHTLRKLMETAAFPDPMQSLDLNS